MSCYHIPCLGLFWWFLNHLRQKLTDHIRCVGLVLIARNIGYQLIPFLSNAVFFLCFFDLVWEGLFNDKGLMVLVLLSRYRWCGTSVGISNLVPVSFAQTCLWAKGPGSSPPLSPIWPASTTRCRGSLLLDETMTRKDQCKLFFPIESSRSNSMAFILVREVVQTVKSTQKKTVLDRESHSLNLLIPRSWPPICYWLWAFCPRTSWSLWPGPGTPWIIQSWMTMTPRIESHCDLGSLILDF